ncbi:MAG TPA: hypothetical protein V6D06_18465 [Trichocoleus sp.]
MSVQSQSQSSRRFADPWPTFTAAVAGLMLLLLMGSPLLSRLVTRTSLTVDPEDTETLPPLEIAPAAVGALRIDAEARIPDNRWLTFEIQVLDNQDAVVASAIKQAWRESGTWSEEGESGTWEESDLTSGLDLRSAQAEPLTIAIHVLEYTTPSGQEVDEPVPVQVTVRNGVVDTRYLWAGLIGTGILAICSLFSVAASGTKVIDQTIYDSDVGDRIVLGGADRLLRVHVSIEADETSPRSLTANLYIKDSAGDQIYTHAFPVRLSYKRENGKIESASGNLTRFFLLEPRRSYGFYVEVVPDGPVDKTQLTVYESATTLGRVDILHLKTD